MQKCIYATFYACYITKCGPRVGNWSILSIIMVSETQEDDFRAHLIEDVQNYPCIYDKANPNHFQTTFTNQKFDEIGAILEVEGLVLLFFQSFQ